MIKQLVTAWSKPTDKFVFEDVNAMPHIGALMKAAEAMHTWLREEYQRKGKIPPTPPSKSVLAPIVKLFGYDPYTGEAYRGVRLKTKLKKGQRGKLKIHRDVTSWTTSVYNAEYFARDVMRNRSHIDYGGTHGYILRLVSSGHQLMTLRWFTAMLDHVFYTEYANLPKKMRERLRIIRKECEGRTKEEDEIFMLLPAKVDVEVMKVYP